MFTAVIFLLLLHFSLKLNFFSIGTYDECVQESERLLFSDIGNLPGSSKKMSRKELLAKCTQLQSQIEDVEVEKKRLEEVLQLERSKNIQNGSRYSESNIQLDRIESKIEDVDDRIKALECNSLRELPSTSSTSNYLINCNALVRGTPSSFVMRMIAATFTLEELKNGTTTGRTSKGDKKCNKLNGQKIEYLIDRAVKRYESRSPLKDAELRKFCKRKIIWKISCIKGGRMSKFDKELFKNEKRRSQRMIDAEDAEDDGDDEDDEDDEDVANEGNDNYH